MHQDGDPEKYVSIVIENRIRNEVSRRARGEREVVRQSEFHIERMDEECFGQTGNEL